MERNKSIIRNKYFKEPRNQEASTRGNDHLVFLICLLLAAIFWLFIKLSAIYSVTYPLKVRYEHIPQDKLLVAKEDSIVNVSFKSGGYNLLDLLIAGRLKYLNVDLADVKLIKVQRNHYEILTQSLKKNLASRLNVSQAEIIFSTRNLVIKLENLFHRKVKINPRLNLKFKSQFGLYGVKVHGVITIMGPRKLVDSLKVLNTATIDMSDLDVDQIVMASVQNPFPGVLKIVPNRVKVHLYVQKFTEFSLKVPIDVSGITPVIRTFPASTTLYFNMFLIDYKKLKASQFKVVPDVRNINLGNVKMLNLRIVTQPKIVSNVRMDPFSVEFIIIN